MVKLRSVLPFGFRSSFLSVVLILCACTSGARQSYQPLSSPSSKRILNLVLVATAGPDFGDRASFSEPTGVAVDQIGEIFVSDKAENSIFKFSSNLELLAKEGGVGASLGGFSQPLGMACDAALNLYVADSGNRRIEILDHNLHVVKSMESYFDENNNSVDFSLPGDISFDSQGNIWVADNERVLKLDPFFNLLLEVSDRSPGYYLLGKVTSIEISRGGLAAIADAGNHRVVMISTYGNAVSDFQAGYPSAVTWDSDNSVWVANPQNGRVTAYDLNGNVQYTLRADTPGSRPIWIAIDITGRLIVIDSGLRKIMAYQVIRG
jgi:DNA-binding beta-propeller fold protein YncE